MLGCTESSQRNTSVSFFLSSVLSSILLSFHFLFVFSFLGAELLAAAVPFCTPAFSARSSVRCPQQQLACIKLPPAPRSGTAPLALEARRSELRARIVWFSTHNYKAHIAASIWIRASFCELRIVLLLGGLICGALGVTTTWTLHAYQFFWNTKILE